MIFSQDRHDDCHSPVRNSQGTTDDDELLQMRPEQEVAGKKVALYNPVQDHWPDCTAPHSD